MVALRDHEKLKGQWPPKFEMPHGFWDDYHPGGEWGELHEVKWVEPNRKGELPYLKIVVRWNDVDFKCALTGEQTLFLKQLYQTLKQHGVGRSLEDVGSLQVDF